MIDKNGIYLSVDGDNAVRVIVEKMLKSKPIKLKFQMS